MSDSLLSRFGPGDPYPEQQDDPPQSLVEEFCASTVQWLQRSWRAKFRSQRAMVTAVHLAQVQVDQLTLAQLPDAAREISITLRSDGLLQRHCAQAFALVRRAAQLTINKAHFDVQILGGWVMLQGMVAEMDTGEGKTLTATLPAATAALAGWSVHIITVNDYLVARDCAIMRPVYEALGLSVAAVTAEMSHAERCVAYRADIVYVSNKTIVFDYLRDRIVLGPGSTPIHVLIDRMARRAKTVERRPNLLLQGLNFAIIDEIDSVLIDEARTPLIISAESGSGNDEQIAREALALAAFLVQDVDYRIKKAERRVLLTEAGRAHIIDLCQGKKGIWAIGIRREELALRALSALHLYSIDEHYLVRDGEIQIIDEFTGRVMPDRSWSQGLHQMIEVKEGCKVTKVRDTLASISYQRFFPRYLKICGMTGTAKEVRGELGSVFKLPVLRIPNNKTSQRRYYPTRVLPTNDEKWAAIVRRVVELNARGVPVLIGTRSVAGSEHAMHLLAEHGLPVTVLNAKQDASEADVVARAGEPGRITIATNMAGRGTDIMLHPAVRELGGLHVILTERHEAGRIDRQLAGRAARQGDPGSYEEILSLEDALLTQVQGHMLDRLLRRLGKQDNALGNWARVRLVKHAQQYTEKVHARVRHQLLKSDRSTNTALSFSGRAE